MPQSLVAQLQPPVKGLNYRTPAIKLDPQEALTLDNLLPQPSSAELRAGYVEHVINIPGSVMTLISFIGNLAENNKVFAATDTGGIYDVTTPTDAPVPAVETGDADGVWDFANTQGGDENYVAMVSVDAGYWTYSTNAGFVKRTLTGAGAGKRFSAVFKWKDRLWFIEENSSHAYYLDIGAIEGPAHLYDFGPVMKQGGWLSYGSNWTFNAGYDIDDYLVLVSTSGEVIVYKGYDPTDVQTFQLQGVWFIGNTPKGNQAFTTFGGELYIFGAVGVVPVSKLVNGQVANDYQVVSAKIQPQLSKTFSTYAQDFGWELETFYNKNFLLVKTPVTTSGKYTFWVMNVQTGAWGTISGMPMNCTSQVVDDIYFGTTDGRVCRAFVGDTDGESYAGIPGRPIVGSYLGGFNDYDVPTYLKTWQLARPILLADDTPAIGAKILTEYEQLMPSVNSGVVGDGAGGRFNVDNWNQCVWSGGTNTYSAWIGLNGLGYYGALAISMTGPGGTQYIATNVTLTQGGVM